MVARTSPRPEFDRGVVTTVHQGECVIGDESDLTLSTVLGSCISACVRDRETNVGGMNHFLLAAPSGPARDRYGDSARYGAFAMEQLINKVLSRGGGRKSNLEFKIFGGGMITESLSDIGAKNILFVHQFLIDEGYSIASEDVGGSFARRVMYRPNSGRAFVKRLDSATGASVANAELAIVSRPIPQQATAGDIDLF